MTTSHRGGDPFPVGTPECEMTRGNQGLNPRATVNNAPAHVISGPSGGWRNPVAHMCETFNRIT